MDIALPIQSNKLIILNQVNTNKNNINVTRIWSKHTRFLRALYRALLGALYRVF